MMNYDYNEKIKYIFGIPDYTLLINEFEFLLSLSYGRLSGLYPYVQGNIVPSELLDIGLNIELHYDSYLYNIIELGSREFLRSTCLPSRIPKDMKHIKNPYRSHLRKLIDKIDDIASTITDAHYLDICNILKELDFSAPSRNKLVYLDDYEDLLNKYNNLLYNAIKVQCNEETSRNGKEEARGQEDGASKASRSEENDCQERQEGCYVKWVFRL